MPAPVCSRHVQPNHAPPKLKPTLKPPAKPPMKRSPLKRKTPLKSKPGARLAHASTKQAARLTRYHNMVDSWPHRRTCAFCGIGSNFAKLEPHHPYGRGSDNLYRVILLCSSHHQWVHEHPSRAYALGWLQPEYRGVSRPPDFPTPWHPDYLITETI